MHSQSGVRDSSNAAIFMWGKLRASRPLSLLHNTMAKVKVCTHWQDNSLPLYWTGVLVQFSLIYSWFPEHRSRSKHVCSSRTIQLNSVVWPNCWREWWEFRERRCNLTVVLNTAGCQTLIIKTTVYQDTIIIESNLVLVSIYLYSAVQGSGRVSGVLCRMLPYLTQ